MAIGPTGEADFNFQPKVWQDHISAYFDRKLVMGQLALVDSTLTAQPGETINFPYFKAIGDAEEPDADSGLEIDKLQDDAFSCSIKEVAKAVGVKRAALRKSAAHSERIFAEVQQQIARVHAEKVDKDLVGLVNTNGNYTDAFVAASASDKCNVKSVLQGKVLAFGDKHENAVAIMLHSLCLMDLMSDTTSGFLQGNSLDPMWGQPGFQGRLLGMAVFTTDNMPQVTSVGGQKTFAGFIFKPNPYGIALAEAPQIDSDYDMLHREYVFAASQWYGVVSLHGKVSSLDKRIARCTFATSIAG